MVEKDIIELEKRYWTLKGQSGTGRFDQETLIPLLSPPAPLSVCPGIFNAFDENRDQHIDFKEIACGISAACRGPTAERQKCKGRLFVCCFDLMSNLIRGFHNCFFSSCLQFVLKCLTWTAMPFCPPKKCATWLKLFFLCGKKVAQKTNL